MGRGGSSHCLDVNVTAHHSSASAQSPDWTLLKPWHFGEKGISFCFLSALLLIL